MRLWPFFCFYGGKWRAAPHYPAPEHETIIEPFAGAAGYSVRHFERKIIIADIDPVISGIWKFLIKSSSAEIQSLPSVVEHVDDVVACQEAKWLIGFWLNKATTSPCKVPSKWMRDGLRPKSQWGDAIKNRISTQVDFIRHWKVIEGSYEKCPNVQATWFIDPPYDNSAGQHYKHHKVSHRHVGEWSLSRKGQIIVCENEGADWLPFKNIGKFKSTEGKHGKSRSSEVIYTNSSHAFGAS